MGEEFDPAELVKHKEGTFAVPKPISSYLSKHVKRCLSKEEREALFKEHPCPDLDACLVDKYMSEFLGKNSQDRVHKDTGSNTGHLAATDCCVK